MMEMKSVPYDVWFNCVVYPLSQYDASVICSDKIKEIQKTGGEIGRSLGVTWLQRIQRRLRDASVRRFE